MIVGLSVCGIEGADLEETSVRVWETPLPLSCTEAWGSTEDNFVPLACPFWFSTLSFPCPEPSWYMGLG